MTHITHHPVTEASRDYIDLLQAALDTAETALAASQGQEARLREALGEILLTAKPRAHLKKYGDLTIYCHGCLCNFDDDGTEHHKDGCFYVQARRALGEETP